MRADSGRMFLKSCRSDCRAISASAPASSTPVGAAPDDHEGEEAPLASRVALALGRFEREQHPPPHLERIVERLEARGTSRPFRMSEIGVSGAGRDDQKVVRHVRYVVSGFSRTRGIGRTRIDDHTPLRCVDRAHLGQQHVDVLLAAENPPDR